jgi:hypothetical protein
MVSAAAQACRTKQMPRLVDCLRSAVEVYEQHPLHAQHESSQLGALLTFIRSAQSLAKTLAIPDDELPELEARAEALRSPIH